MEKTHGGTFVDFRLENGFKVISCVIMIDVSSTTFDLEICISMMS